MNPSSSLYQEMAFKDIEKIFSEKLNHKPLVSAKLLSGGMFNTTYLVDAVDGTRYVLRLGPVNRHLLLDFETHLMEGEMEVLRLFISNGIPCPAVLVCDTSRELADRDYMIMEYIPAVSLSSLKLSPAEKAPIYKEVGRAARTIASVTGEAFGRVSHVCRGKSFGSWADAVCFEIRDIMDKLIPYQVFSPEEGAQIRRIFEIRRSLLDEVKTPYLQHADLWDGNVLVAERDGAWGLSALIDADRAVFGDVDYDLSTPWITGKAFYSGYGVRMEQLPENRRERQWLYQVNLCLVDLYVNRAQYHNVPEFLRLQRELLQLLEKENVMNRV